MNVLAKRFTVCLVALAMILSIGVAGPEKAVAGDSVEEYVERVIGIYDGLDEDGRDALEEVRDNLDGLSKGQWESVLGDLKEAVDDKDGIEDGTAQAIVEALTKIICGTDEDLEDNVNAFRDEYADEFDLIFGPEVTVDTLFEFLVDYEEYVETYVFVSIILSIIETKT